MNRLVMNRLIMSRLKMNRLKMSRLIMNRLVMNSLIMSRLIMNRLVMNRFIKRFQYIYVWHSLRKHAYSNIMKISPPKTEKLQIKKLRYFSYFCSKHRLSVLVRTASARRF